MRVDEQKDAHLKARKELVDLSQQIEEVYLKNRKNLVDVHQSLYFEDVYSSMLGGC